MSDGDKIIDEDAAPPAGGTREAAHALAREAWERAYVFYVDIEATDEVRAEAARRWPAALAGAAGGCERGFLALVDAELTRARAKHKGIHSRHEGYAVVLEELDEVKAEVWRDGDDGALLKELVQTAAMCARMAEDLALVVAGAAGERELEHGCAARGTGLPDGKGEG